MSVAIPVLETARLTLRGYSAADLDDALSLWSDPEVVRHVGGKTLGREDVWARLLRYVGHWALAGHGFWQIRERGTDRFVGETGLADFQRDVPASFALAPEAGWVLRPWSHGKGYATEAMTAVLAWAEPAFPRTTCIIRPANTASLRVAAKLGFRELGRPLYQGAPVVAFERLAR